ncbi:unnamed protein product [Sphagnum jensenii]|uniref:Uncharacterized protein n=1 Tax=Sphagnum jensenii TaxID=128206 RepID=A0ABP0V8U2_9BRYO
MDVVKIIDLVADLSIGLDTPTADDQAVFLKYLNLAHAELFRKTAAASPVVKILRENNLNVTDGKVDALSQTPFLIRTVTLMDQKKPLLATSLESIEKTDPLLTKTGQPWGWYYANKSVSVYPLITSNPDGGTGQVGVSYLADPAPFILTTLSADIPYPVLYHPVLVDGTCYYLFQTEAGFKNDLKMKLSLDRWNGGKSELLCYLRNLSGQQYYSTYTEV